MENSTKFHQKIEIENYHMILFLGDEMKYVSVKRNCPFMSLQHYSQ